MCESVYAAQWSVSTCSEYGERKLPQLSKCLKFEAVCGGGGAGGGGEGGEGGD